MGDSENNNKKSSFAKKIINEISADYDHLSDEELTHKLRFLREVVENSSEKRKERTESIMSAPIGIIEKIQYLSYNPYSRRDIVDYMLTYGPYLHNILANSSLLDDDGNDFIDFVESDNNIYFRTIGELLKELEKPAYTDIAEQNAEMLARARLAVYMWETLNELRGGFAIISDYEMIFKDDGGEPCTHEDAVETFEMAVDYIAKCANSKELELSASYYDDQIQFLSDFFKESLPDSVFSKTMSVLAKNGFAQKAPERAVKTEAAADKIHSGQTQDGMQKYYKSEDNKMTDNEHENKRQPNDDTQAEQKSPKKALKLFALLILGCTLLGAGLLVLGNTFTMVLGVLVLLFDVLFAIILPISYFRARNLKLCQKCKTQYDYDNDIAYNEVSRYTKTRNVTLNKNSDPSKLITEQFFIVYNVDCQCHNCGERRSYQKKVVAGEAHYDGSVTYKDPQQIMEQFYRNSFLGTEREQKLIKIASIAMSVVGVILIIVGIIL